jgi:hypothetical protein
MAIVGFGYFLGEVTTTANANTEKVKVIEEAHRSELQYIHKELMNISNKTSEIDGKIDVMFYGTKKKRKN